MYPEYFGLKEASFSITPDPRYLYLSHQHQEALAHLLYGAMEGGGFVLLTGEVGTGKTTVCRAFLEQRPDSVDVALVLNPALTVQELLHTVCDEFGIEVPAEVDSSRLLVERLNRYLLQAHAGGRRPVLLIDEAQNLSPAVLEQIRLLTNLETHRHKLLQIFLIGQPELGEVLRQPGLRQLAQRITARYHLRPLSPDETGDYIRHRLAVAGVGRRLFTAAALRRIHRLTGGIPRLINILCDRTLLGAYATQRKIVDSRIVNRAFRELRGEQTTSKRRSRLHPLWLILLLIALTAGAAWLGYNNEWKWELPVLAGGEPKSGAAPGRKDQNPLPVPDTVTETEMPATPPPLSPEPVSKPVEKVAAEPEPRPMEAATASMTQRKSVIPAPNPLPQVARTIMDRQIALARLAAHWGISPPAPESIDPCSFIEQQGLRCRQGKGSWDDIRFHDRPALIELSNEAEKKGFALLTGIGPSRALLETDSARIELPLGQLGRYWKGGYIMLWRPPPGGGTLIGPGSSPAYVRWLRQTLARAGIQPDDGATGLSTAFDLALSQAVKAFQRRLGLKTDGLAGPETLIQLNNAARLPDIPHLEKMSIHGIIKTFSHGLTRITHG
jgi:general secretion pathway protein A